MNSALSQIVSAAVCYYATHAQTCTDPGVLFDVCEALQRGCQPQTPEECNHVGLMAAKECAMPTREVVMNLINPEEKL